MPDDESIDLAFLGNGDWTHDTAGRVEVHDYVLSDRARDEVIEDGGSNDKGIGRAGDDTFVVAAGSDTIMDFADGEGVIYLSHLTITQDADRDRPERPWRRPDHPRRLHLHRPRCHRLRLCPVMAQ